MRYIKTFLVGILIFLALKNFGQTTRVPLSEKSVVRDSLGVVYAYEKWFSMIKSGDYNLQKSKTGNDDYILIKRLKATKADNKSIYGNRAGNYIGKKIRFPHMSDLYGKDYSNEYLKDKIVVLNFWFTRCTPCISEMPLLNQIHQKYSQNKDVVFLAICLDTEDTIIEFLKRTTFKYNIVPSGLTIANHFDVKSFPTNIIIENGVVNYSTSGYSKSNIDKAEQIINKCLSSKE